jgi:hypothetical protein
MSEQSDAFTSAIIKLIRTFKDALAGTEWSTREQPRKLLDEKGLPFTAPSLFVWRGPTSLSLDPTGYDIPGADGVVDLYLLPDYAPVATLYLEAGVWRVHSPYPTASTPEAKPTHWYRVELSSRSIPELLEAISQDAALST